MIILRVFSQASPTDYLHLCLSFHIFSILCFLFQRVRILELNKIRPFQVLSRKKTRLRKCLYKTAYWAYQTWPRQLSHVFCLVLFWFGFNLGLLKIKTFIWLCGSLFLHTGSLIFHRGVWTLSLVLWDTVTWPGVEPGPLRWECGFSAIGPPGKSVRHKIFSLQSSRENLRWGAGRLTDTVPRSWWWFPQPEIVLNFGVTEVLLFWNR